MGKVIDLTGQRFGRLIVTREGERYVAPCGQIKFRWICACDCGNEILIHGRSLTSGNTKSCGCLRKDILRERKHDKSPNWIGDNARYRTAHDRVCRVYGPASKYNCLGCDRRAQQWAFDHSAARISGDIKVERSPDISGVIRDFPYSTNPRNYVPLCVRCHSAYDRERHDAEPSDADWPWPDRPVTQFTSHDLAV